jgi:hypothetical protein
LHQTVYDKALAAHKDAFTANQSIQDRSVIFKEESYLSILKAEGKVDLILLSITKLLRV